MLRSYYTHVDFKSIFDWLGNERHREFSFWYEDSVVSRKITFDDYKAFKETLLVKLPLRVEIGPIYDKNPRDYLLDPHPKRKEFTIDVDMTDMHVLTDHTNPAHPSFKDSWLFLVAAVRILHTTLTEDFGFKHILCVFSGRRGVHLWVCDKRAMSLTDEGRSAVLNYLRFQGTCDHPSFERAWRILGDGLFMRMIATQGWFLPENREKTLSFLKDKTLETQIAERLGALPVEMILDPEATWGTICATVMNSSKKRSRNSNRKKAENIIMGFGLALAYPVLDEAVSRRMDHLLKMPFMVHPSTSYVSVPLDPTTLDKVDSTMLPTIEQVCIDKNVLVPYMDYFRDGFLQPLMQSRDV